MNIKAKHTYNFEVFAFTDGSDRLVIQFDSNAWDGGNSPERYVPVIEDKYLQEMRDDFEAFMRAYYPKHAYTTSLCGPDGSGYPNYVSCKVWMPDHDELNQFKGALTEWNNGYCGMRSTNI